MLSVSATAVASNSVYLHISCEISYDDPERPERAKEFISAKKIFQREERKSLSIKRINLLSYYFSFYPDMMIPEPKWHENAELELGFELDGSILRYKYSYKNYIDESSDLVLLKEEERVIQLSKDLSEGAFEFHYDEGSILSTRYESGAYINESGVKVGSCKLQLFNVFYSPMFNRGNFM